MWEVRWDPAHRLVLDQDGETTMVHVTCCFPWSHPRRYISLRNDKGVEQAFVPDLQALPDPSRRVIDEALQARSFIPEITAIDDIADDKELYVWSVTTQAGPRKFLTERRDHVRRLDEGAVLIRDVARDMFIIRDPAALDAKSFAALRSQMD